MKLSYLIIREILHRRLHFLVGVGAVAVASGCLVGAMVLLNIFDLRTRELVGIKEAELAEQMAQMENEFRKITKRMGFNVLILPKEQKLDDFYADNYAKETMPEEYAHKLANARGIVTVRHLLPMLQMKTEWPEKKRKILLIGVRGEMAWAHRSAKKPILKPVPAGSVTVGFELHNSLGLKKGDTIQLMGKSFKVHTLQPVRGSVDDITLWIDLEEAQQMLKQQKRISAMLALECKCAWANLAKVRREIQAILPDTQVIEMAGKALARAEARNEATRNAKQLVEREKESRILLRAEREEMIAILVPVLVAATALLLAVLAFLNVRERRQEIGILRALGVRSSQILFAFLGKAILIGLPGAAIGVLLGLKVPPEMVSLPTGAEGMLIDTEVLVAVVLLTPLVCVMASWLPAMIASQQDAAIVLREE